MIGYDVAVVGGRVAGAATALLLARAGVRVVLLERSSHGSDTLSTHALMRAGVLQLSRWGVLPAVVAAGTPAVHRSTFHYAGLEPVQVTIKPSAGVDALYAPRRTLLDRLLVDAAAEAGADVRHRTTVEGLLRDDHGRVGGVVATAPDGARVAVPAAVTVGADGIRSLVAREAGAAVLHRGRHGGTVYYRYFRDLPTDGYEWAYGHGAAAGLIPTNDDETCAFVGGTPERLHRLRREGVDHAFATVFAAASEQLHQRLRAATPVGRRHGWEGPPGHLRQAWGPGWALVGDAGLYRDPITTHGITDALRDAEVLTDAVVATLGSAAAEPAAMAGFQRTRDRLSAALFAATDDVASYAWDVDEVQGLLRQVSSAMSDEVDFLTARDRADTVLARQ